MEWARAFILVLCALTPTAAHADEDDEEDGGRDFPKTLTIDEPGVDDETSLPTIVAIRHGAEPDRPAFRELDVDFELDKRLTDKIDVQFTDGYTRFDRIGAESLNGWQNLEVALKGVAFEDPPHEFILSGSVIRTFGSTGAEQIGADRFGATGPMLYAGRGLGEAEAAYIRPLAFTGILSYSFPDEPAATVDNVRTHTPEILSFGATIQYSLHYLGVERTGEFASHLTPLIEFAMTTPATQGFGTTTEATVAPGLLYSGDGYQLGLEALIPVTRSAGTNIGVIAQLNISLRHFAPDWAAKPIF